MNPKSYTEDYLNPLCKITAKEKWKKDTIKQKIAENGGFGYLIIWENDFKQNKNETIERCIKFLNE